MKQEDKELLLRYLSMALLYGVKVTTTNPAVEFGVISGISIKNKISVSTKRADIVFDCTEVKPFLRPMSSMTEEEKKKYSLLCFDVSYYDKDTPKCSFELIKWLLEKHFDFLGLISKGLAIEVTGGNNPYK